MRTPPVNRALAEQLVAAIHGTKLEAQALEEQAKQNARDVAAAQRRRKRRAYRSARAAARRESVENWKGIG